jgi:acetyl esterase/lipase
MRSCTMLIVGVVAFVSSLSAAEPWPLWPGNAPHAIGDTETDKPSITPFLVPKEKATGAAVVICPGGGYGFLAADHEGTQVAEYFNKLGVHAFVLKYRIVTKDRPGPLGRAPLADVNRAIRMVRSKAEELGIDRQKIGLMGFSAGGHLASTGGTHFDAGARTASGERSDDIVERNSSRPDFLILGYPVVSMEEGVTHGGSRRNLLGANPDAKEVEFFSNEKQVTKETPPTFIFHTTEDKAVKVENAVRFYMALVNAGVPAEMHIYEEGKHGVGLGSDPKWTGGNAYTASWPDRLTAWLKLRGVVK